MSFRCTSKNYYLTPKTILSHAGVEILYLLQSKILATCVSLCCLLRSRAIATIATLVI
jgi:hypothetical protein